MKPTHILKAILALLYVSLCLFGWYSYHTRVLAQKKQDAPQSQGLVLDCGPDKLMKCQVFTENGITYAHPWDMTMVTLSTVSTASTLEIMGRDGSRLVSINLQGDGKITYGKNYTPDAAAQAFWNAVAAQYPCKTVKP